MTIYKTDNLALAPFLYIEGLKYIGCDVDTTNDNVFKIMFMFEDEKEIGSELALEFARSRERLYKNAWSFFRNEIEQAKQKLKKE